MDADELPGAGKLNENGGSVHILCIKLIVLPRQARDKRRESTQKDRPFSCLAAGSLGVSLYTLPNIGAF